MVDNIIGQLTLIIGWGAATAIMVVKHEGMYTVTIRINPQMGKSLNPATPGMEVPVLEPPTTLML